MSENSEIQASDNNKGPSTRGGHVDDMFAAQNRSSNRFHLAFLDLYVAIRNFSLWSTLGYEDIKSRYHRTYLGMIWLFLLFFIQISVFIFIFAPLRGPGFGGENYATYLAYGFLVWSFIIAGINSGTSVFNQSKGWIMSTNLPFSLFIFRNIFRESIPLVINFCILLVISLIFFELKPLHVLSAVCVLPVYMINFLWMGLLLGTICSKFRDLEQFVSVVTRISFFLTPIIWTYEPGGEGGRNALAGYNPFTHYIEVFRQPIMGYWPSETNFIVVAAMTVVGSILGFCVFAYNRRNIPLWL